MRDGGDLAGTGPDTGDVPPGIVGRATGVGVSAGDAVAMGDCVGADVAGSTGVGVSAGDAVAMGDCVGADVADGTAVKVAVGNGVGWTRAGGTGASTAWVCIHQDTPAPATRITPAAIRISGRPKRRRRFRILLFRKAVELVRAFVSSVSGARVSSKDSQNPTVIVYNNDTRTQEACQNERARAIRPTARPVPPRCSGQWPRAATRGFH